MRLIRTTLIAAVLCLSFTGAARAQFELTWDKCPGSMGASSSKRFACNDESVQPMTLVVAFTPPRSLPRFVGITVELEIASSSGDLPDWWKLGVGECRDGSLTTTNTGPQVIAQCQNPWSGTRSSGGSMWSTGWRGASRSRLMFTYARESATALSSGTRYFAAAINIDAGRTNSGCSGCQAEVCIALTSVELAQEVTSLKDEDGDGDQDPGPDDVVSMTHSNGTNIASFNLASGDNACGSKTRNRTWGQVKATYR